MTLEANTFPRFLNLCLYGPLPLQSGSNTSNTTSIIHLATGLEYIKLTQQYGTLE